MINHELKDLFKQSSVHKKFVIDYDGGTITNSDMFMEEFSLEESLCSEEELRFGNCEASVVQFPISNTFTSLNGKVLDVSVVLDHNEDKPLKIGKYKVESDVPTADRKRKDITAYDALYDVINANVADWYNALLPNADSAVTLKQFRDSFFGYFGIEQVEVALVNDDMIVTKTIQPTELSGSVVANAICELNGCFGHINRDGLMDYVFLEKSWSALYPSEDLYPRDDKSHKYSSSDYQIGDCDYEDYVSRKITGLEIRQAENSIGAFIGTKENPYIVSDNFLTYGKSTEEMTTIAQNMFGVIKDIEYRPFTLHTFRGNPCVEVGDGITIYTDNKIVESYILNRTLTGIQALTDSFEARGREYRTAQVNSVEKSLIQLRGKTNTLERTLDETRSEITKVETNANDYTDEKLKDYSTTEQMNSVISQTADNITTEVSKTYATKEETESISTRIEQTADMIAIGIDENGNLVTDLTLDKNGITFVGNYLVVDTKNLSLDKDGNVRMTGIVDALALSARNKIKLYQKSELGLALEEVDVMEFRSSQVMPNVQQSYLVIGDGSDYVLEFANTARFKKGINVEGAINGTTIKDIYSRLDSIDIMLEMMQKQINELIKG